MITPLTKVKLKQLCKLPIMFDANIFMVGIEDRYSDGNCSFENMNNVFVLPLLECFENIIIHETVYDELDQESKIFLSTYIGKNVTIVSESNLYDNDPKYNDIFNKISEHELVQYNRSNSKDKGEVYSLAYAAYYKINYFCCKEIMVDII